MPVFFGKSPSVSSRLLTIFFTFIAIPYWVGRYSWATHARWAGLMLPLLFLSSLSYISDSDWAWALLLLITPLAAFAAGDRADSNRHAKEQQALKQEADEEADEIFGQANSDEVPNIPHLDKRDFIALSQSLGYPRQAIYWVYYWASKISSLKAAEDPEGQHVSSEELCCALVVDLIESYDEPVDEVLENLNIHSSIDIGRIIWGLIDNRVFTASENESISDFAGIFDEGNLVHYLNSTEIQDAIKPTPFHERQS